MIARILIEGILFASIKPFDNAAFGAQPQGWTADKAACRTPPTVISSVNSTAPSDNAFTMAVS
ncbi:MAG: hypothetical protein KGL35_27135 [Bradyrhizobium sp.]|uniref:hypothetical protein n=1 Tax=Bradyrhizobium sp. TaxID=376 RepID=UPI002397B18C|nr:hypothetical protein [Bradyrhizobium sp.]MDE2067889.1 hypothetical protein [Bradyrhizobium sp.]MDE2472306.1 hypothetical protein [Bradyrhizobium sp.]